MEKFVETKEKSQDERRRRKEKLKSRIPEEVKATAPHKQESSKFPEKEDISGKPIEPQKETVDRYTLVVPFLKVIEPEENAPKTDFDTNLPALKPVPKSIASHKEATIPTEQGSSQFPEKEDISEKYIQSQKEATNHYTPPNPLVPFLEAMELEESSPKTDFDRNLPTLKPEVRFLTTPKLSIIHYKPMTIRTDFDKDVPEIKSEKRVLFVPKLSVISLPESMVRSHFDREVSMRFASVTKAIEKRKIIEEARSAPVGTIHLSKPEIKTAPEPVAVVPKEIPVSLEKGIKIEEVEGALESAGTGLCDLIFESKDKNHSFESILGASSEKPIIILAEKSDNDYIDALKLILRETYRIKVGGLPEAKVIIKEGGEVEKIRPEDCIIVVDDKKGDLFKFSGARGDENFNKVDMEKLLDERIEELFAQKFGFLVFYVTTEIFDALSLQLTPYEDKVKIIPIKLKKLSIEETENISSMVWGFLKYERLRNLSGYFGKYEKMFYEKLEKLSKTKHAIDVKESAEDEENGKESDLHYLIKLFLVKYLREVEKIENLETEFQIDGVIPDIYVPDKHLAIEVETLYGTGVKYLRKLGRTIEKYKDKRYELWLVLPNLQLLLFYKHILEVKNKFKDNVQVKFWTLDLKNGRLVSLEEIQETLKIMRKNLLYR